MEVLPDPEYDVFPGTHLWVRKVLSQVRSTNLETLVFTFDDWAFRIGWSLVFDWEAIVAFVETYTLRSNSLRSVKVVPRMTFDPDDMDRATLDRVFQEERDVKSGPLMALENVGILEYLYACP